MRLWFHGNAVRDETRPWNTCGLLPNKGSIQDLLRSFSTLPLSLRTHSLCHINRRRKHGEALYSRFGAKRLTALALQPAAVPEFCKEPSRSTGKHSMQPLIPVPTSLASQVLPHLPGTGAMLKRTVCLALTPTKMGLPTVVSYLDGGCTHNKLSLSSL